MSNRLKRLLSLDRDAIAGVRAAVTALVLHLLHLVQPGVLLTIILAGSRAPPDPRPTPGTTGRRHPGDRPGISRDPRETGGALRPPDMLRFAPGRLQSVSERFAPVHAEQ